MADKMKTADNHLKHSSSENQVWHTAEFSKKGLGESQPENTAEIGAAEVAAAAVRLSNGRLGRLPPLANPPIIAPTTAPDKVSKEDSKLKIGVVYHLNQEPSGLSFLIPSSSHSSSSNRSYSMININKFYIYNAALQTYTSYGFKYYLDDDLEKSERKQTDPHTSAATNAFLILSSDHNPFSSISRSSDEFHSMVSSSPHISRRVLSNASAPESEHFHHGIAPSNERRVDTSDYQSAGSIDSHMPSIIVTSNKKDSKAKTRYYKPASMDTQRTSNSNRLVLPLPPTPHSRVSSSFKSAASQFTEQKSQNVHFYQTNAKSPPPPNSTADVFNGRLILNPGYRGDFTNSSDTEDYQYVPVQSSMSSYHTARGSSFQWSSWQHVRHSPKFIISLYRLCF